MAGTSPAMTKKSGIATRTMLTEAATYDALYRNFSWDVPERFNMAAACCDRYADGSGRLALIYARTGQHQLARRHWERFLSLFTEPDPDLEWMVSEAKAELKKISD